MVLHIQGNWFGGRRGIGSTRPEPWERDMSKTATLRDRQSAAVAPGVATKAVYAEKARNAELWDVDGRRFLDFADPVDPVQDGMVVSPGRRK